MGAKLEQFESVQCDIIVRGVTEGVAAADNDKCRSFPKTKESQTRKQGTLLSSKRKDLTKSHDIILKKFSKLHEISIKVDNQMIVLRLDTVLST